MCAYFPITNHLIFGLVIENDAMAIVLIVVKSPLDQWKTSQFCSVPPSTISDKLANTAVLKDMGKDAEPLETTLALTDGHVIVPHCLVLAD